MKALLKRISAFCLCLWLSLSALSLEAHADVQIDKVLATTSITPVALMDVSNITAATSTSGCYIASYGWYDLNGNLLQGKFSTDSCRVELRIDTYDGFFFSESVAAYLNNEAAAVSVDPSGRSLKLTRDYSPAVWQPTVVKNPGSESVDVGGWASFVATATYVSKYEWKFVSPEGNRFSLDEAKAKFPGMTTSDNGTEKLNVYGIPAEMNGWKILCTFSGPGGSVDSSAAKINVKVETVEPSPTPEPTPEPSAEPEKEEEKEPEHEHVFSDTWSKNELEHWKECECGELSSVENHKMLWTQVKEASRKEKGLEEGKCGVCGYTQTRETEYKANQKNAKFDSAMLRKILLGCVAVIVFITIIMIILSVRNNRRRRRRRRRR